VAGAVGGVLSGLPSTAHSLTRGADVLGPTAAAGTLVLAPSAPRVARCAAGLAVHSCLSLAWGVVLSALLPRRAPVAMGAVGGAAAGLAIAALDLGLVGRRFPAVRALPAVPQVLDHVAFGVTVAVVLRVRRRRREAAPA